MDTDASQATATSDIHSGTALTLSRTRGWLRTHPAALHTVILTALWALFFWRYVAPEPNRVTFPDGDFTQQFFIFRDIAFRQLAAGQLPLWTDCFFGGYPFHADPQSQLFYPPVWISFGLLRLMGYGHFPLMALTLEAIGHYLAISVCAYFFLREETGSRLGALVGSIVLAYGGYLTGYPPLQTGILETVTWLPLALLAMRRLAAGGRWRAAVGAVGALSVAFFAGHPQTFLFVAYLSIAYFVFRSRHANRSWGWVGGRLAAIFGLVGLVTAVQLLPQAQYLSLSTRAGLPFNQLAKGLPLGDLAQVFVTQLVSRWHPLYVGILGLTLVALATILRRDATTKFWLAVALVALVLSFGGNAAGYHLAYWLLPGYRLFRGQERAAMVVAVAAATLAGLGAAALSDARGSRRRQLIQDALRWLRNLTPLAVVLLITSIFLDQSGLGDWSHLPPRFGLLLLGLALTILILGAQHAEWQWRTPLVIGVVTLELFSANMQTNAVALFETYPHLPLLDPIQVDAATGRWFRVQDDASMQGHWACGYGLQEWGGISPIRLQAWADFDDRAPELVRWSLLGIDYVISWKQDMITREDVYLPAEVVYEGPAPQGDAKVYALAGDPRRAWVVGDVTVVDSDDALWDALREPGFDPRETAVMFNLAPNVSPETAGTVTVVEDRPGYLELEIEMDRPGLLVVSEAWYPGWFYLDESGPVAAEQVDGFAQAVRLDATDGPERVRLAYRPPLLHWGALASALGLLLTLAMLYYGQAPTRRAPGLHFDSK